MQQTDCFNRLSETLDDVDDGICKTFAGIIY
jgi:hypothetical protein